MKKHLSELDTKRFGFPVAKITESNELSLILINELKQDGIKLIIARVELNKIEQIQKLESIGFRYMDAQVTFNYKLDKELPPFDETYFKLLPYKKNHVEDLILITKNSFKNYGHYFADPKLDKIKCGEIYSDWIERCCENKNVADDIIVAEKNGKAIGYLAIKKRSTEKENYYAGVIGAVDDKYRKYGVFKNINLKSLHYVKNKGACRVENNVLVTNMPVISTYINLAYKIIRSEMTMHYWCD